MKLKNKLTKKILGIALSVNSMMVLAQTGPLNPMDSLNWQPTDSITIGNPIDSSGWNPFGWNPLDSLQNWDPSDPWGWNPIDSIPSWNPNDSLQNWDPMVWDPQNVDPWNPSGWNPIDSIPSWNPNDSLQNWHPMVWNPQNVDPWNPSGWNPLDSIPSWNPNDSLENWNPWNPIGWNPLDSLQNWDPLDSLGWNPLDSLNGWNPIGWNPWDSCGCNTLDSLQNWMKANYPSISNNFSREKSNTATTGIFKNKTNGTIGLSAYPNPVINELTIDVGEGNESLSYKLLDALGRTVLIGDLDNAHTTINTSSLANGVYYLTVTNRNEAKSIKIVK